MSELKIKALNICLILILTGTAQKLFGNKSEKIMMKMIVTIIVIISLFGINISEFKSELSDFFSNGFSAEASYETEKINEDISKVGMSRIFQIIKDDIREFDNDAEVNTKEENDEIIIEIISDKIDSSLESKIITGLKEDFDCEFKLFFRRD